MLRKTLIVMAAALGSIAAMSPAAASDRYQPSFVIRYESRVVDHHHDYRPVYRSYRHDDGHHYSQRHHYRSQPQYRQQHYYQQQYYQPQYQRCGGR